MTFSEAAMIMMSGGGSSGKDPRIAALENATLLGQYDFSNGLSIKVKLCDELNGYHIQYWHMYYGEGSYSCYKEIVLWSDNNPGHLPITILLEPKKMGLPLGSLRNFGIKEAIEMDKCLRDNLGEKLFTPSDMLRDYASFAEMRKADDWCEVNDLLGKVIVLLHKMDGVTTKYIDLDPTLHTQAMFPTLRTTEAKEPYASYILANDPKYAKSFKVTAEKEHLIVRTRVDVHPQYSAERRELALSCNTQIATTDFPPRINMSPDEYYVTFPGEKTVRIVQ